MIKILRQLWKTIVFSVKTIKVWDKIAPIDTLEPRMTLSEALQLKSILAFIERKYSNVEDIEEDELFIEGIKLYSLNDTIIEALTARGFKIYRNKREFYKAQSFELL